MMTEEEKKAIKELTHYTKITDYHKVREYNFDEIDSYIKIVLNLLSKKDKVIKEMGSLIFDEYIHNYSTLDELIEAVYKKVEKENE